MCDAGFPDYHGVQVATRQWREDGVFSDSATSLRSLPNHCFCKFTDHLPHHLSIV